MNTQKKQYAAPEIQVAYVLTGSLLDGFSKSDSGDNTGGNVTPPETGDFAKQNPFALWGDEDETVESEE